MKNLNNKNINLEFIDDILVIFNSYEDYRSWHQKRFKFSGFTQSESDKVLEEEKPDSYPCTPLILGPYSETIFLSTSGIEITKKSL